MATIQVRDIPEEDYETIRKRARASGQSIQAYMHEEVVALARRRSKTELLAAVEDGLAAEESPGASLGDIVDDIRELREGRE